MIYDKITDAVKLLKEVCTSSQFTNDLFNVIKTRCAEIKLHISEKETILSEQIEINKRLEKQRLLGVQANNQIRVMEKQIDFLKAHIDYLKEYKEEAVE